MTSVPPTQPPAAPETDVRLTDAEVENHTCCLRKRLCRDDHFHQRDVERIVAERVRVVEGERDAVRAESDARVEGNDYMHRALSQAKDRENLRLTARAESAEAAHAALVAAVEALADEWERPGPKVQGTPEDAAAVLRALLAGGAR